MRVKHTRAVWWHCCCYCSAVSAKLLKGAVWSVIYPNLLGMALAWDATQERRRMVRNEDVGDLRLDTWEYSKGAAHVIRICGITIKIKKKQQKKKYADATSRMCRKICALVR